MVELATKFLIWAFLHVVLVVTTFLVGFFVSFNVFSQSPICKKFRAAYFTFEFLIKTMSYHVLLKIIACAKNFTTFFTVKTSCMYFR